MKTQYNKIYYHNNITKNIIKDFVFVSGICEHILLQIFITLNFLTYKIPERLIVIIRTLKDDIAKLEKTLEETILSIKSRKLKIHE